MTWVMSGMLLILVCMYYISRYKKKYKGGVIVFAIASYAALMLNYFVNSGSMGPTIFLFFVTFIFLILLGRRRHSILWMALHCIIVCTLLGIEYYYPETVPDTYPDRYSRYIDLGISYIIGIIFFYSFTSYLRNYYLAKAKLADERSEAIIEQNKYISAQNLQLETVNNEKNKLFSIISHDLKSPLDSIRGFLELLSDNALDEDDQKKIQEELIMQTKYTSDLLVNLMSWAKTQMHGVTVNLAPLNLSVFVEEIVDNKIWIAARKQITVTYSIDPGIDVVCDKDMLNIVLRNLVNNAIKFTNPGGTVTIKVATDTERATVSVQDTGIGIPKEKQADIFTLKTRSTFGTNREKGIGLGLMMCKEFIDYQNGEIWFETEVGKGSTFFVSLPLHKA
jgi:signal transduction histidine kinase